MNLSVCMTWIELLQLEPLTHQSPKIEIIFFNMLKISIAILRYLETKFYNDYFILFCIGITQFYMWNFKSFLAKLTVLHPFFYSVESASTLKKYLVRWNMGVSPGPCHGGLVRELSQVGWSNYCMQIIHGYVFIIGGTVSPLRRKQT